MFSELKRQIAKLKNLAQRLFICQIPIRYIGLNLPHPLGIVIASESVIHESVVIFQNVTIGRYSAYDESGYPTISQNCIIYAGAVIAGNIVIGEGVVVAANAVVTKSVPNNCLVYGYNKISRLGDDV